MINDVDKGIMYLVAVESLAKLTKRWDYNILKDNILEAIKHEKIVSYYSTNGSFRQCGKTTMLIKMLKEIDNSYILVGNESNRRNIQSKLNKLNLSNNRVILISNKKDISSEDLCKLKGRNINSLFLVDDSVSEETIFAIRKYFPDYTMFGFTFKKAVSLI